MKPTQDQLTFWATAAVLIAAVVYTFMYLPTAVARVQGFYRYLSRVFTQDRRQKRKPGTVQESQAGVPRDEQLQNLMDRSGFGLKE